MKQDVCCAKRSKEGEKKLPLNFSRFVGRAARVARSLLKFSPRPVDLGARTFRLALSPRNLPPCAHKVDKTQLKEPGSGRVSRSCIFRQLPLYHWITFCFHADISKKKLRPHDLVREGRNISTLILGGTSRDIWALLFQAGVHWGNYRLLQMM
jgi:hypothetical protein